MQLQYLLLQLDSADSQFLNLSLLLADDAVSVSELLHVNKVVLVQSVVLAGQLSQASMGFLQLVGELVIQPLLLV